MHFRHAIRMGIRAGAVVAGMLAIVATGSLFPVSAEEKVVSPAARRLEKVDVQKGRITFVGDGNLSKYTFFQLDNPPRLVVDLPGVKPAFSQRNYAVPDGFDRMRVGAYEDKVRFVLESRGKGLPRHDIQPEGNALVITWTEPEKAPTATSRPPKRMPLVTRAPLPMTEPKIQVEGVDFRIEGDTSLFSIDLSSGGEVIKPELKGKVVHFGVKNADISPAHRRTIETFAFPSAIRRITPYTAIEMGHQEVRFAVELKDIVPYTLEKKGNTLQFLVQDQKFAQVPPPSIQKKVEVPEDRIPQRNTPPSPVPAGVKKETAPGIATDHPVYTGQKISLVFDNADIKNILQLIAEVSNLNIVASEDVQGTITIRLVDIPWDQALALILEVKNLGQIRTGNVVRIMPLEKLRAMEEAKLTAARSREKMENLQTHVLHISYTDVSSVAESAKKLLTERGKLTEDRRNKQLIVTDVPSVIDEIKKLTAILDVPERQVLIEARIVEALSTFSRDIGVKWGISHTSDNAGPGSLSSATIGLGGGFLIPPGLVSGSDAAAGLGSGFTFGRIGVDSTVLDLRLSALESSGYGKIISTPRVTTMNGATATIGQGQEIPYLTIDDDGKVKTEFKKAELKLIVTPEINPDGSIFLKLQAHNDARGEDVSTATGGSAPAIDTKQANTTVLVRDGETTVIGGIFVEESRNQRDGVPFLMKIPILGHLFQSNNDTERRRELLVFVTPRIIR